MKYKVEVKEVLSRLVEVKAKSEEEAIKKVEKKYRNEEIVLDWKDNCGEGSIEIYKDE